MLSIDTLANTISILYRNPSSPFITPRHKWLERLTIFVLVSFILLLLLQSWCYHIKWWWAHCWTNATCCRFIYSFFYVQSCAAINWNDYNLFLKKADPIVFSLFCFLSFFFSSRIDFSVCLFTKHTFSCRLPILGHQDVQT